VWQELRQDLLAERADEPVVDGLRDGRTEAALELGAVDELDVVMRGELACGAVNVDVVTKMARPARRWAAAPRKRWMSGEPIATYGAYRLR
jgi:hypothetical protein